MRVPKSPSYGNSIVSVTDYRVCSAILIWGICLWFVLYLNPNLAEYLATEKCKGRERLSITNEVNVNDMIKGGLLRLWLR